MATVRKTVLTTASPEAVWDAVRDVGALHTRLVPGFVTDTKLEGSVRIVTFGNGVVVREPIVTCDDDGRRLVWTAQGGLTTHYNAAVEVHAEPGGGTRVTWTADFLPDSARPALEAAITAGITILKATMDKKG